MLSLTSVIQQLETILLLFLKILFFSTFIEATSSKYTLYQNPTPKKLILVAASFALASLYIMSLSHPLFWLCFTHTF